MNKSRRLFLRGSILGTAAAPFLPFMPDKILDMVERYQLARLNRPIKKATQAFEDLAESEMIAARMTAAFNIAVGDLMALKDETGELVLYSPDTESLPIGFVNKVIDEETVEINLPGLTYDGRGLFED